MITIPVIRLRIALRKLKKKKDFYFYYLYRKLKPMITEVKEKRGTTVLIEFNSVNFVRLDFILILNKPFFYNCDTQLNLISSYLLCPALSRI